MMELTNKHIIITGGTTGIGFQLAQALLALGNEVLVVDFSAENIEKALAAEPKLKALKADLSNPQERETLVKDLEKVFPDYDVLVNNAGIQRWINLQNSDKKDWSFYHQELAVNFEAPLHLSLLTLDQLLNKKEAAIINVSSGLVINPGAWVPFYTAGKTGLHGYSQVLRLQLQDTNVKVFEVFPPAVNTNLGGSGEHTYGVSLDDFIPAVIKQIQSDQFNITFGTSNEQFNATKEVNDQTTQNTWNMFKENPTFLES
ncbi:SDR family NAD(P)-dependent oxidoreductase [Enterococcus devriesei]|uniref:SDR family NAD(P)-dependent oxidoreductase n=1 Tax=Enterococcus devriesei TaxID=319970 RepID=UPI001C116D7B|nr:SDR family NAD(P)-dependent oxidoreductase [Enterococcus devriesei]MBU5365214.1 SDR family NAD(P)-dependent oxidoreductase [Enterococcus devriesei]